LEVDIGVKAKVLLAGANSTAKATAPLNLMLVFLEIETVRLTGMDGQQSAARRGSNVEC
jgi:hypothetical protein